jgi:hypothetical protein
MSAPGMNTELAAAMPWLCAQPDSMWNVTGLVNDKHTFQDCLARVLPPMVTGVDGPVFEVLIYGGPLIVNADKISKAQELLLVYASDPRQAYYAEDQVTVDRAAR